MNEDSVSQEKKEQPLDELHTTFGFTTPIPDEIIKALPKIGADAFSVWCYLMFRIYNNRRASGEFVCWPSYNLISEDTGLSRHRISKAIKTLETKKWIARRKRFSGSTIYTLISPNVRKSKNGTNGQKEPNPISQQTTLQSSTDDTTVVRFVDANQDKQKLDKPNKDKLNNSVVSFSKDDSQPLKESLNGKNKRLQELLMDHYREYAKAMNATDVERYAVKCFRAEVELNTIRNDDEISRLLFQDSLEKYEL